MLKTSKKSVKFCFVLITATLFFTLNISGSAVAEVREMSLSLWSGGEHYHTKALQAWAKDVEAATKGQVKIIFYPGGTLTNANQAYNGLVKGVSDLASSCNGWTPGRFPLTEVADLQLSMQSSVQASLATWDFYKKFKPKEWDEVEVLYLFNHGHQFLHTKKPVNHFEDMKGLQIRSTGNDADAMRAAGATPVSMSIGEAYISLQKGVVDGILCNFGAMMGWKLADVVKNHFDYPMVGCGFWVAMNKKVYQSLSPDVQKAFKEVSEKHVLLTGQAWEQADQDARKFALSLGNTINKPTAEDEKKFQQAFKPLLEKYVAKMKGKGLPGQEALDFFAAALKKYEGR